MNRTQLLPMLVLSILLVGCTALTPEPTPVATAMPPDIELTELTFAGNGETFLDYIAGVKTELGQPDSHRFVERQSEAGDTWQGEELQYGTDSVILLQQVSSGGKDGLELRTVAGEDWRTALEGVSAAQGGTEAHSEPEIRYVRARQTDDGVWSFDVTLAYPDTGWEDYADGWHIESAEGDILATRILLHPHVNEQPFTRGQGNVSVPLDADEIVIRAHTLLHGYSSETVTIPIRNAIQEERFEVIR